MAVRGFCPLPSICSPHFVAVVALVMMASTTHAATLPAGFKETLIAQGLSAPTAMQFAPDGRLFVCEQGGRLRVVKDGVLLPTPFVTLTVSSVGERGLLGVTFDPNFFTNRFVYAYYTATSPTVHNRVSRFVANGDVAVPGSETVILELDDLSSATNHNGGALNFGPDGKLYVAVGDNANGANAQSLNNLLGKVLRINGDGTIPPDNPYFHATSGRNRAIWALGLRNPFTFAFNPAGNEFFINDVGQNTWEEINDGIAGANYGWPQTEGPTSDSRFQTPRHAYRHLEGACAVTGGAFYAPAIQFPSGYESDYFFADFCAGWIHKLDLATGSVAGFATGISFPVDLKVGDDGTLYYLARGPGASSGVVYRIEWVGGGAGTLRINFQPASAAVPAGYLPDSGLVFAPRADGWNYGWNADSTAQARDRNASNSPDQRYDTLMYMQRPGNPDAVWEIALPNDNYRVRVVAGDPSFFGNRMAIAAEGALVVSGTTTSTQRWLDGGALVAVSDGRLTIRNAAGAEGNKICFVEISSAAPGWKINFQPASAAVPAGYVADSGAPFALRASGDTYGWNADNTAQARDRNAPNSPDQRYDTLAYMQRPGNPDAVWEIAVPNGTYTVRVVAGDPSFFGNRVGISAEGVTVVSGTTTSDQRWLEGHATVTVGDGRLTIRNAPGADGNKICFVEITP
jgi:glucose/arabinose dehydrogenase